MKSLQEAINELQRDPWHKKTLESVNAFFWKKVLDFCRENEGCDWNQFNAKVNRWGLDRPAHEKPTGKMCEIAAAIHRRRLGV